MSEHDEERPVGALVWIVLYMVLLALGWLNVYLRLWY